MEKLSKEQINELSLDEAKQVIEELQRENKELTFEVENLNKHKASDGALIDAVKLILDDLWCA